MWYISGLGHVARNRCDLDVISWSTIEPVLPGFQKLLADFQGDPMLRWCKNLAAGMVLLALFRVCAVSTTIYNNGSPNQADAENMTSFIAADDFQLSSAATLTGITFWSSADVDPFTSQFSGVIGWGIFSSGGGIPGTLLASGFDSQPTLIDTGVQIFGTEEYEISVALPSVGLTSGTYWLGLHEGDFGTPDDGTPIYWDTTASQTGSVPMVTSDLTGVSGWFPGLAETNLDLAFELSGNPGGSVLAPEPTLTWPMLMLLGLGWFWLRRRRLHLKPEQSLQ